MRIVVITTLHEPLNSIFWNSYLQANGPIPDVFFILPSRRHRPTWQSMIEPLFLFTPIEIIELFKIFSYNKSHSLFHLFPKSSFISVASVNKEPGLSLLQSTEPDVLVAIGAVEIFRAPVLAVPKLLAINIHNGRLPKYRGIFATFWEMYFCEPKGYVTIHEMIAKVDSGPILAEAVVPLNRGLLDALVKKKWIGGHLLAELLLRLREGELISKINRQDVQSGYFRWPSILHLIHFKLHNVKRYFGFSAYIN